jgi:acyl-CoA synthetase (AMP-forming)/AMP-acid ligase II
VTLADLVAALPGPTARALWVGDRALSRQELWEAGTAAAARDDAPAVRVGAGHPEAAVVELLAAQLRGAVPVITGPRWPLADEQALLAAAAAAGDDGPVMALLTSGTGGSPRAVLRSCASWTASLDAFTAVSGTEPDDLVWAPGAPSSTMTLFCLWHALATGVPVLASGRWRGVAAAGPAVAGVTLVHAVPPVLRDVLEAVERGALPRLRRAVVAGAALPRALRDRARRAGVHLVEYYGAAELSFVAVDPDGDGLRPFPGVEVAVRDGMVWARSPYLSAGYLTGGRHRSGTGTGDGPLRWDPQGWASVGDSAELRDGRLELHGRAGAAVTVGGHTVPVEDVEAVLREVSGVRDVVCLGLAHPRFGEQLVAVLEPEPGTDPRPAARAAARAWLPPVARPTRVLLATLPRTPGGKVRRAAVRTELLSPGPAPRRVPAG